MHKNAKIFIGLIGIFIFVTLAQAYTITEGFEGKTFPPAGWDTMNFNADTRWIRKCPVAGGAYADSSCAFIKNPNSGLPNNNNWLITPNIGTIVAGDSVIFWLKQYYTTRDDSIFVKICTTATHRDTTKYLPVGLAIVNTTNWERKAFPLGTYAVTQDILPFVQYLALTQLVQIQCYKRYCRK